MKKVCIIDIKKKFRKKYLRQPSIDFDFCNIRPQSIAMLNIHELADKKVSLSSNVFVFSFFFIAVKPNWHHQTFP